ncbi:hypothetical protein J5H37_13260 [Stenotrophomonas maltophilia]|uniref:3-hydroxyacyl-CoA dehydrogenase NAD-binding domain-containing protein n=1 Tax=Stenotrophomonas maltophilia TaxID=40324 RepID=UPI000B5175D6|nr:3-hydroxyacyl-CoA dehydrogenase NAD-binding domain-containing protein [Stenotrophomonas maltophilia]ASE51768.1 3-hydroxyacyl-CoA dehydrogenase [Stenotrophomonas maltophilia]MBN7831727.1 hypothetical protein [Stenotrophomonas maltophilia]MBN7833563.1 hypothetical protein [Stenotrophomonas maltophilia]MBN7859974.1 hypothetical protein [Stenotrophomonas maltophilia]MBN7916403.1 hypothetical protein [Stenotrophomonas maltophilia]
MASEIQRIGVIGTGVIGASWTSLFLAQGLDVFASDVAPGAEDKLREYVDSAWPALRRLGLVTAGADPRRLEFSEALEDGISACDFVQENGPERQTFKQDLYSKLDVLCPEKTIIASSSSGLTMTEIQKSCAKHPQRCVIGHPFNPPHLIPLVEIVGGERTSEETILRTEQFYSQLGKKTIRLKKEVPGHVANRLSAALFREVIHLISEDVVSVADVDAAVSCGPGLRWGVMGPTLLYHLGGGSGGIEHFFDQFTGPMTSWWNVLGTPTITPEVREKVVRGVLEEAGTRTIDELERQRDQILLGLLELRAKSEGGH